MTQARVRRAFETALATFAAAQNPPLAVAYENVEFAQPAPTAAYLRCFLLPGEQTSRDIARTNRRLVGVFQVSIVMPTGGGHGAGEALVAALDAAFPPATPLVASGLTVWLTQPLSAAPAIAERDRHSIPCSLPYAADAY